MKALVIFFTLIFLSPLSGCIDNPTADSKTKIGATLDGLTRLNKVLDITLVTPTLSPSINATPTIRVRGLNPMDRVYIYSDAQCSNLLTSQDANGNELLITLPMLAIGTYVIYAKRRWENENIESDCSQVFLNYEVLANNLIVTGLSNDSTPRTSKTWNWNCSGASTTCEYRFVINTSSTHTFTTEPYGTTTSATQNTGTGTYYIHVQARDATFTTIDSLVHSYSAVLDNTGPTVSTMGASSNGTYNPSQNIDFTVNFNENVTVAGTPRLTLTVGSSTRYATYQSGSGGTALVFRYSPSVGDLDTNGIAFSNTNIDLNSGTLRDALSNNATLSFLGSAPSLTGINVDGVVPTVSITSPSVINSANASSYAVGGACSENGRQVSVSVGGVSATPNCSSSAWTATVNVSGVSDGAIDMTADHSDAAGNNATSATASASKDTVIPTVSITSSPVINDSNASSYSLSGTCSENGRQVSVSVGGVSATPNCSSSAWTATVNVSGLLDGTVDMTADHSDAAGNNATSATASVNKNTSLPTVSITSPSVINSANASSYSLSGTCSENGRQVSVSVGGVSATPNCSSSAWTATVNVSGVSDGTTDMTADHNDAALNNANSATASVSKDTMAPTVST